jgi:methyl-accepting chemotaxis protein
MKIKGVKKAKPPSRELFKGFSLTFRISLGITLLITMLMAAVGFATFIRDRDAFMEETYSRGWSTVRTIQTLSSIQLKHQNYRVLNDVTTDLAGDNFIKEAAILNSEGYFVAHNNQDKLSRPEQGRKITELLGDRDRYSGYLTDSQGNTNALTFAAPIKEKDGILLGYVYLVVDILPVQIHLQETMKNILFNFILAALAGMILTRLIVLRSVHRPVQSLVKVTEKVSTGDFSQQVKINTKDELGRLAQAFNTMSDQLGVLFDSIRSTVNAMGHTSNLIIERSKQSDEEEMYSETRQREMMKEINSAAKKLTRMSDKLNSLALQFKTESTDK